MDTTGSMWREIDALKAFMVDLISTADSSKVSEYLLSQFNDPGITLLLHLLY